MLTSGDADELRTLFSAFAKTVPVARARTKAYFGFEGILDLGLILAVLHA